MENPYAEREAREELRRLIGDPSGPEEPLLPHVCDSMDVHRLLDLIDDLQDAARFGKDSWA